MKESSDNIGNRTRDLRACSAVPQPTALPPAPLKNVGDKFKEDEMGCTCNKHGEFEKFTLNISEET